MLKLALLLCVLAPLAEAQTVTARIQGLVRSMDGDPIPRAKLLLEGPEDDKRPALFAASGDDGRFHFDQIPPGRDYFLTALRPGYAEARYPAPLTLDAGAAVNNLEIVMTPQGVIRGKITDPAGDPVVGAPVLALRPAYESGMRRMAIAARAWTNDQGEYRIANLAPGTYSIGVMDRRVLYTAAGRPPEGYAPAYSAAVRILPGGEARNIDIRLRRQRVYSIRGKVAGEDGSPANGTLLAAVSRDDAVVSEDAGQVLGTTAEPDAAFEFRALAPGTYLIQTLPGVRLHASVTPQLVARQVVTITDRDVNNVLLIAGPGASVAGIMTLEGAGMASLTFGVSVELEEVSAQARNPPAAAAVSPDGRFLIEHAAPSAHYLNVHGLPANVYVKSARFNGQDVTHTPIELAPGGGDLQIVLSVRAAGITGIVRDPQGGSLPAAVVTLWPAAPDPGKANHGVRIAASDQNGAFTFHSLAPGEYLLAAWEPAEPGLLQDYPFLMQFAADAARLTLTENAHAALEAPLIPLAKIRAAESQLP